MAEPERRVFFRVVSSLFLILLACALQPVTLAAEATPRGGGSMPMTFEPNQGQADAAVKFLARGRGYGLFLTPTETVLVLAPAGPGRVRGPQVVAPAAEPVVVRMRLVGADPAATIAGVDPLPGRAHYLLGDRDHWRRSVPSFARVQYSGVYPGVSLVFYGTERQLEYDFVVAPGADPAAVALAFDGADGVRLDGDGDLVLSTGGGELRLHRPVIYQEAGGERRPIEGGYVLDGDRVRFRVAAWDASRPLVIDPVLGYSTFLGGSSSDQGFGIAVDSTGNAYVTGSTVSSNFPVSSAPLRATRAGVTDAFVTKLSPGGTLLYSTFLGGTGDDAGHAIAVDAAGNAYVVGTTNSTTFPVLGAFQSTLRGGNDAFVAKLDPSGSTLVYSTYLGSNTDDTGNGIALDAAGNAYVTGSTASAGFPNNGAVTCLGTKSTGDDAFVAMLDTTGATVGYCRFIGGSGIDSGQAIAADAAGNVWFVGATTSSNLPVVAAVQPAFGGRSDGFIGKLDPTGAVVYLTYLGGTGTDLAFAVAADAAGNAYVTGSTDSIDFPTVSPLQPILGGGDDAFVAKLNAAGSALVFATFLGGIGDDAGNGIAVHPGDSSVYVAGSTKSLDFPTVSPIQPALAGRMDAFVARLNPAGGALVLSTYLGGAGDDVAQAISVDADAVVYVTGSTNSTAFPTTGPVQTLAGLLDAFVTQIADAGVIQFTVSSFQVSETGGSATISVQRAGDTSASATVQFATSDGTAHAPGDYQSAAGTLPFSPGQIIATFTVTIVNNVLCDGNRTVNLTLLNPSVGTVLGVRRKATLTINDDEPSISFSTSPFTVLESQGSAPITITRSGPLVGQATVLFSTSDGTATAPADYTAVINRLLTFPAGVSSQTVSIPIVQDTLDEVTETVNLTLSSPSGGSLPVCVGGPTTLSRAILNIVDDDVAGTVQFLRPTFTVKEPTAGPVTTLITVTRTGGAASAVTVNFSDAGGGTAAPGVDYTLVAGTLTFAAGQTTRTFPVSILHNPLATGNLTVNLQLTGAGGGASPGSPSTAVLTIVDAEPRLSFTSAAFTTKESTTATGNAIIGVVRTGGTGSAVTVNFSDAGGGTATPGVDYTLVPGTLTFAAGQVSRTFPVAILHNPLATGNLTVNLQLTGPGGGASLGSPILAVLTIVDGEPKVGFAASTITVREGTPTATITVRRTGATTGTVTVDFATSDPGPCPSAPGSGNACAGTDYVATSGTLTFTPGVASRTFGVPISNDTVVRGTRSLLLNLTNPTPVGGVGGTPTQATLTILDNDVAGVVQFSLARYTVRETAGSVTITVTRTGGAASNVTVDYAVNNGTAVAGTNFAATSGTLTFGAGQLSRTFAVPILDDGAATGNLTATLTLTNPGFGATLGVRSAATLAILDNASAVQFSVPSVSIVEAGVAVLRVERSGPVGLPGTATVHYATADGSANAGACTVGGGDYLAKSGNLTFGPGVTALNVTVQTCSNTLVDGDRTFTVTLSPPISGTAVGVQPTGTVTIRSNDVGGTVQFSAALFNATECAALPCHATLTVSRTGGAASGVTVDFTTADGTATSASDYVTTSDTITFGAGQASQVIRIPLQIEPGVQPVKSFSVTISNPGGGAVLGTRTTAEVRITDPR